jgi:hypothetical protein
VIAATVGITVLSGLTFAGAAAAATPAANPPSRTSSALVPQAGSPEYRENFRSGVASHDSNDSERAVEQARKRLAKAAAAQKEAAKAAEAAAAALIAADTTQRRAWKSAANGTAATIKLFIQLQNEYDDDPTPEYRGVSAAACATVSRTARTMPGSIA